MMEFLKKFISISRTYNLIATLASCFILYTFAHTSDKFTIINFLIIVLILCCVHLGASLYDDYKQVKEQLSQGKKLEEVTFNSFFPKAELLTKKVFSIKSTRRIINSLFVVAFAIGISFSKTYGWLSLIMLLFGIALSLLNSYASKHYLAEIITGFIFGPLIITGGYYVLIGEFEPRLLLLSIAVMFAVMVYLHTINIMNWEFDIKDGKKTLALLTGSKQNAIKLLNLLTAVPLLIILGGVLLGEFNKTMLFVFITLLITTKLIPSMKDYIAIKNVEFKPRWYWGCFENWKSIKEQGIDFFMFRAYLARNYALLFTIIAGIGVMK